MSKTDITSMTKTQKDISTFCKNVELPNDIKVDCLNFIDISKYVISTDKSIVDKKELNQELSEQEISYMNNERSIKIEKLNELMGKLNEYLKK